MLVQHPDGTSTGDAFVIFADEEFGKAALKKHRGKIGQRYVELFRSTQAELQQVIPNIFFLIFYYTCIFAY